MLLLALKYGTGVGRTDNFINYFLYTHTQNFKSQIRKTSLLNLSHQESFTQPISKDTLLNQHPPPYISTQKTPPKENLLNLKIKK